MYRPARRSLALLLAALGLLVPMTLVSPSWSKAPAETMRHIATSLVVEHAAPRYRDFAAETAKLSALTGELCAAPTDRRLQAVRDAFVAALLAWQRVQHIRFGPVMAADRFYRIEYWPDKHGQGERQLRRLVADIDNRSVDVPDFSRVSVAIQGFPALERLLYGTPATKLIDANSEGVPICRAVLAISRNLAKMAKETAEGWQRDYVATAKQFSEIDTLGMVTAFYKAISEQTEFIKDVKIGDPLGKSPSAANPRAAELWRSDMAERSIADNLRALNEVFRGSGPDSWGLSAALEDTPSAIEERKSVEDGFSRVINQIDEHPELLGETLRTNDGWRTARLLQLRLGNLRDRLTTSLAAALGVSLGFNSLDGD
ncbi:hypothetical protein FHS85_004343 [Rhodoligotrophos appendicifer]|uniref:imelysin family protein n=1 Tax=Rhodoligotrophos appendicifer TaxID=987056 RepID=UPI0011857B68|nr:imelysin family protein [Rhodoligotrophos appendicifer]